MPYTPFLQAFPKQLVVAAQHNHQVGPPFRPSVARMPVEQEATACLVVVAHLPRVLTRVGVDVLRIRRRSARVRLQIVQQLVLVHLVRLPFWIVGFVETVLLDQRAHIDVPKRPRSGGTGERLTNLLSESRFPGAGRACDDNVGVASGSAHSAVRTTEPLMQENAPCSLHMHPMGN